MHRSRGDNVHEILGAISLLTGWDESHGDIFLSNTRIQMVKNKYVDIEAVACVHNLKYRFSTGDDVPNG